MMKRPFKIVNILPMQDVNKKMMPESWSDPMASNSNSKNGQNGNNDFNSKNSAGTFLHKFSLWFWFRILWLAFLMNIWISNFTYRLEKNETHKQNPKYFYAVIGQSWKIDKTFKVLYTCNFTTDKTTKG